MVEGRASDRLHRVLIQRFQSHPWHGVSAGPDAPNVVTAYLEMVPTDTVKYELDKASGLLRIDRPQRFSNVVPSPYGFVPQTFCGGEVAARCMQRTGREMLKGDGDPLDICILTESPLSHGDLLCEAIPVGGLRLIDREEADDKIVAVLRGDATYGELREIADCPSGLIDRLRHYFLTYKQPPDRKGTPVEIAEIYDRAEALVVVNASIEDYRNHFGDVDAKLGGALPK
jgi:inorganic pyrophosphatase